MKIQCAIIDDYSKLKAFFLIHQTAAGRGSLLHHSSSNKEEIKFLTYNNENSTWIY
jgi:hypothetical protein